MARRILAQAAGVVRECLVPKAGIKPSVPSWITENGVTTGLLERLEDRRY